MKKLNIKFYKIKKDFSKIISFVLIFTILNSIFLPHFYFLDFSVVFAVNDIMDPNFYFRADLRPQYDYTTSDTMCYYWDEWESSLIIKGKRITSANEDSVENRFYNAIFHRDDTKGIHSVGRLSDEPIAIAVDNETPGESSEFDGKFEPYLSYDGAGRDIYRGNGSVGNFFKDFRDYSEPQVVEVKTHSYITEDGQYVIFQNDFINKSEDLLYLSYRAFIDVFLGYENDLCRYLFDKDQKLLHFVDDNYGLNGKVTFTSFDVVLEDSIGDIKLDFPNICTVGMYKSRLYSKMGEKPNMNEYNWGNFLDRIDIENTAGAAFRDTALTIGWANIPLRTGEEVTRRMAFSVRPPTYYVNSNGADEQEEMKLVDEDGNPIPGLELDRMFAYPGAYDKPFKTVKRAMEAIGDKKGYIYIQDEGVKLFDDSDIEIKTGTVSEIGEIKEVTIASADVDKNGNKLTEKIRLEVPPDYKFIVEDGASLSFSDIILDGGLNPRNEEFITQNGGLLYFNDGTEIEAMQNSNGSAVINSLGGELRMYGTTIKNCQSKGDNYSAINFNGSEFNISGVNKIYQNFDVDGGYANVFLNKDKQINVTGNLFNEEENSKIYVNTEISPTPNLGTIVNETYQVPIVKISESFPFYDSIQTCPVVQFFKHDIQNGIYNINSGSFEGTKTDAVVTKRGNTLNYKFVDPDGLDILSSPSEIYCYGDSIQLGKPPDILGHTFKEVTISPPGSGLIADENGVVSGTMPDGNALITYEYEYKEVKIKFETNGGTPENIPDIVGKEGDKVSGILSSPIKQGYVFQGWFKNNDNPTDYVNDKITALPSVFPSEDVTYYARYKEDVNIKNIITEEHTNNDGTIVFFATPEEDFEEWYIGKDISYTSINVPGYIPILEECSVSPSKFIYNSGEESVGEFTSASNKVVFDGKMPGTQTLVTFRYQVDPNAKYDVNIDFVKKIEGGREVPLEIDGQSSIVLDKQYSAEEVVSYSPPTPKQYKVIGAEITGGYEADPQKYLIAAKGTFAENSGFTFNGNMPNQEITLKYIYESTIDGIDLIADYIDIDTKDAKYKYIKDSYSDVKGYAEEVTLEKQDIYGYLLSDNLVNISGVGSFDSSGNFTGTMGEEAVIITYEYSRDSNYFKNITFKPNQNEEYTVSYDIKGLSPDLEISSDKQQVYVDTLISSGDNIGWTYKELQNRKLIPKAINSEADFYELSGFFIDENDNGVLDGGEVIVTDDMVFEGGEVLVPVFSIASGKWINIGFEADDNGTIDLDSITNTEYRFNARWASVQKPIVEPKVGYVFADWYYGINKMTDGSYIMEDAVYTARFIKDPAIFGTVKKVLSNASIDDGGKGVIKVRDTNFAYPYVMTDISGKVLAVKTVDANNEVVFDSLDGVEINKKYYLYEVNEDKEKITIGSNISNYASVSEESSCFVPAIDDNYEIVVDKGSYYNENKDVATLVIEPADEDSEYALYEGNTPITEWKKGNINGIEFDKLTLGKAYNVVTRKDGEERTNSGSIVYIEESSKNEPETYLIYVVNGKTSGEEYFEYEAGATVEVSANSGSFAEWVSFTDGVTFDSTKSRTTTLTMPRKNVAIMAKSTDVSDNTKVSYLSAGLGEQKFHFINHDYKGVADDLMQEAEEYLVEKGLKLEYKVLYDKEELTFEEESLIQGNLDPLSARGAIAVTVDIARYVDDSRIDDPNYESITDKMSLETFAGIFGEGILEKFPELKDYIENQYNEKDSFENEETENYETEKELEELKEDIATSSEVLEETEEELTEDYIENTESKEIEDYTENTESKETKDDIENTESKETKDNIENTENKKTEENILESNIEKEEISKEDMSLDADEKVEQEESEEIVSPDNEYEEEVESEDFEPLEDETDKELLEEDLDEEEIDVETEEFEEIVGEEREEVIKDVVEEIELEDIELDIVINGFSSTQILIEEENNSNDFDLTDIDFSDIDLSDNLYYEDNLNVSSNDNNDVKKLYDSLITFGSHFPTNTTLNTLVTLPKDEQKMENYKVFRVSGGNIYPVDIDCDQKVAESGAISFVAEKGERYIIAYERINEVTFINNSPGAFEMTDSPKKKVVRVKNGETVKEEDIGSLAGYIYEGITYNDGVWSYKEGSKEDKYLFKQTDEINGHVSIYAYYLNNMEQMEEISREFENINKLKDDIASNKFLTKEESEKLNTKYQLLLGSYTAGGLPTEELESMMSEFKQMCDEVRPHLLAREEDYKKNMENKPISQGSYYTGGGGGGGSGGGGGTITLPKVENNLGPSVGKKTGDIITEGYMRIRADGHKEFIKNDGTPAKAQWIYFNNGWYHANEKSVLDIDWFKDVDGSWYYLEPDDAVGNKGLMQTGLFVDYDAPPIKQGANIFYLQPVSGEMKKGWQIIGDLIFYFNEYNTEERPLGTLYVDEITPDGLPVRADGAFIYSTGLQYDKTLTINDPYLKDNPNYVVQPHQMVPVETVNVNLQVAGPHEVTQTDTVEVGPHLNIN